MTNHHDETPIIKVEVERLDSEDIEDHVRSTAAVLHDILADQIANENLSIAECAGEGDDGDGDDDSGTGAGRACSVCFKLYKNEKTLQAHYLLKHPSDEKIVRCVTCDKIYPSSLSLQKHVRYKHLYKYRCSACYRTFPTEGELERHADSCTVCESPCAACGKVFTSRLALRNHVNYKHPMECQHWCGYCRRVFTSGRSLNNHLNAVHPPAARSCQHCNRNFSSGLALRSHILYKHSDGFRCSRCRKVFTTQERLDRHVSTLHANIDQINQYCGLCGKTFKNNVSMMNHILTSHY